MRALEFERIKCTAYLRCSQDRGPCFVASALAGKALAACAACAFTATRRSDCIAECSLGTILPAVDKGLSIEEVVPCLG